MVWIVLHMMTVCDGGSFGGEGYKDYKNQNFTENSIMYGGKGSETCPGEFMNPALTLVYHGEWKKCFCCVDRKETNDNQKHSRCDAAGIDCNPANRYLGGFMLNCGKVGSGGRSGEGKIGTFQTEEYIAESDRVTAADIRSLLRCG